MKKTILVFIVQVLFFLPCFSQIQKDENKLSYTVLDEFGNELTYYQVLKLPSFPGGLDSLYAYLDRNIIYPSAAKKDDVYGDIKIAFTIDTIGNVKNIEVVQGLRNDLDSLCVQVISNMPQWTAGIIADKEKATVRFVLPLRFKPKEKK